jgi:hypothetical protein
MDAHSAGASAPSLLKTHFRVADAWAWVILSNPATVARGVHGEKGGAGIEALLSIHPAYHGTLRLARLPENSNPMKSGIRRSQSHQIFRVKNNTRRMTL